MLLLLDVDGPLNPYKRLPRPGSDTAPEGYDLHHLRPTGWETGPALRVLLSPWHGDQLRALSATYTPMWATTWEHDANKLLAPLLGLPDLPVIECGEHKHKQRREAGNDSWKTHLIADWIEANAPGEPWAWVDDEVSRRDRGWLRQRLGPQAASFLTMRISPYEGLTAEHFERLRGFAADL